MAVSNMEEVTGMDTAPCFCLDCQEREPTDAELLAQMEREGAEISRQMAADVQRAARGYPPPPVPPGFVPRDYDSNTGAPNDRD